MAEKTSALVLAGNGTNCEMETAQACTMGGFDTVDIVTVWELLAGETQLRSYDMLCLPGGFLDGDDLGSAKAQTNRMLHSSISGGQILFHEILSFIRDGKLIIGICNGFQLMVKLGLLPALNGDYGTQTVTLTNNDSGRFEDRWVSLVANTASPCVYTKGIERCYFPVRHGEGKLVVRDSEVLDGLMSSNQIVFQYADQRTGELSNTYPDNPNGSQASIAGLCDVSGRLFGLMPHPEAYLFKTNHPRWTREEVPEEGMGVAIFRNACGYVRENL